MSAESRSQLRRIAIENGEELPTFLTPEKREPCTKHLWYNLPGNYTRKCENCELEESIR